MQTYQQDFLSFAIELNILKFGHFTLKSGRQSPYFFNAGLFNTGNRLAKLGEFYAQTIIDQQIPLDMLFGPAYKGIPLATTTSIALANKNMDVPYAFNRKEMKDHGEGGNIVGSPLQGKVLIIDDVISAGTSVRESIEIIQANGATPAGVIIALDRQEQGKNQQSAIAEIKQQYGLTVWSIINLQHMLRYLQNSSDWQAQAQAIENYRQQYGTTP